MVIKSLQILITTYNGEKYISEQLDSLFNQTVQNFIVLIRDDDSVDNTLRIINNYIARYPEQIVLVNDNLGNLGSSKSFMRLLGYSCSDYVMFCDQDDVWLPSKIELSLKEIEIMEHKYSESTPLLVFTDLMVVDYDLKIIANSFWNYQKLDPNIVKNWKILLAQNVITGCTVLMNKEGKEVCLPYALDFMLHDHWIGVNIAKYGKIHYLKEATILYRQHHHNVEGAHRFGYKYLLLKIKNIKILIKKLYRSAKFFGKISFVYLAFLKIYVNIVRILR